MIIEHEGFRFGVRDHNGRQSSVYRVWKGKKTNDIYLANRNVAGDLKVSLHESGNWQVALTEQYVRNHPRQATKTDRYFKKWLRPLEFNGITMAFAVVFPTSELGVPHFNDKNKKVIWLEAPQNGHLLCVEFIFYSNDTMHFPFRSEDGGTITKFACIPLTSGKNFLGFHRIMPVNRAIITKIEGIRRKIRSNPEIRLKDSDWDRMKCKKRIVSISTGSDGLHYFVDALLAS